MLDLILTCTVLIIALFFLTKHLKKKWRTGTCSCAGSSSCSKKVATGCSYCSRMGDTSQLQDFSQTSKLPKTEQDKGNK